MFDPVPVFTDEMTKHKNRLKLVLVFAVILAFCKFGADPNSAINELILCTLLLCGLINANFCVLVFFMILKLMDLVMHGVGIAILIQRMILMKENPFGVDSGKENFYHLIVIFTFVFDIIALNIIFEAYKCFKEVSYKNYAGFVGQGQGQRQGGRPIRRNDNYDEERPVVNNQGPARPFQGRGMRIGGDDVR